MRDGDRVRITSGSRSLEVDGAVFGGDVNRLDPRDHCTALLGPDRSFVALHSLQPDLYTLYCVDTHSGNVLWQTVVWALNPVFSSQATGPRFHEVSLTIGEDVVGVFGAAYGCYVEAFDIRSGANVLRFSTNYWGY
jgi:hypothetical protein